MTSKDYLDPYAVIRNSIKCNKCVFLIANKSISLSGESDDNEYLGYNEHLGVEYIIAVLEKNGFHCAVEFISDQQLERIDELIDNETLMVGLPMYIDTVELVLKIAARVKERNKQIHVCIGGPQTMGFAGSILEENIFIDSIVEGEGEYTTLDLVQRLQNKKSLIGCNGLTHRFQGQIIHEDNRKRIHNLDELPYPTRHIFEKHEQEYMYILGNRGCMGGCSFCDEGAKKGIYGKPYVRNRQATNIVDELEYLYNRYGVSSFRFSDATFDDRDDNNYRKDQAVYEEIIKRNLKVRLHIFSRVDLIDKKSSDELSLASRAGVECIYLGIESANEQDLKLYRKHVSKSKALQAIHKIKEAGIHPGFGFIFFNPLSTYEGLKENAEFLHASNLGHVFYLYQTRLEVLAQSHIKNILLKENLISGNSYRSNYHEYKFQIPQIGILCEAIQRIYKKPPIYYMDTMLAMDKIWLTKHMDSEKLEQQLGGTYQRIREIQRELNELNYLTFLNCLDMSKNGASVENIIRFGQKQGLDAYHDEVEKYYTKIKVKTKKISYLISRGE